MTAPSTTDNPYLAVWSERLNHQRQCNPRLLVDFSGVEQPDSYCFDCDDPKRRTGRRELVRAYSWAIPNEEALDAIARHSPDGVVEIGAGGGYWAKLLRDRGVDVVAYDPDPDGGGRDLDGHPTGWHDGTRWSHVDRGDHTAVAAHPDRTLLLVWPSYSEAWTDQVLDLYAGSTVVYVGESSGGCTGSNRMHVLLGSDTYCWHDEDDEDCNCAKDETARFEQVEEVRIPQWSGIRDWLFVYRRIEAAS